MGQTGGERWAAASQKAGKRGTEAVGDDLTSQTILFFFFFLKKRTFPMPAVTATTSKL